MSPRTLSSSNTYCHAIVIGGSMAGLLAAQVLTNHFDQVTLLERDRFPDSATARAGVPQARHVHVLMQRGQRILEQFFPGYCQDMVAHGATLVDVGKDLAWLSPAGWTARQPSGLEMLACSRDLLEWGVRHRVLRNERVQVCQEIDVTALIPDSEGSGVSGVLVRRRGQSSGEAQPGEQIDADLIIDASGRTSKTPHWLAELGYPAPTETLVNAQMGYASRIYQLAPALRHDWKALYIQAAPPHHPCGGLVFPQEGNRWLVSFTGPVGHHPSTDEAGFLAFTRALRHPAIANALKDATPLTPIYGFRGGENRLRHYDRLTRWPEGLVVLGDALCTFNPVYAQGMTIAALEALALDQALQRQHQRYPNGNLAGLGRSAQRAFTNIIAAPWLLATSEDCRYHGVVGATPDRMTRFMHGYMDRVLQLATQDADTARRFGEVLHMLKSPNALFAPALVGKLLKQALYRQRGRKAPTSLVEQATESSL